MFKATLAAASLITYLPLAYAGIDQIDEAAIIKAVDSPVLKQVQEEDSPGCTATRYTFGDKLFDMKLEFKCNRINVAWTGSEEPKNLARSKIAEILARRAVIALSEGDGIEVEKLLAGERYRGRVLQSGLVVNGSCVMNTCILTFK